MALGRKTGGRKKGTPNKETKALREMILCALDDVGGQQYLARQAEENPAQFLALIGKVLPTTINGNGANGAITVQVLKLADDSSSE